MHTRRVEGGPTEATFPEEQAVLPPPPPRRDPARSGAADARADEQARLFAENARARTTASDATSAAPRPNDDILYLGMNTAEAVPGYGAQNDYEAKNLAGVAAGRGRVVRVAASGSSVVDGHDLSKEEGVRAFAKTLGLPPGRAEEIANVLLAASVEGRDELAGLAVVLARGERGEPVPSRWILSGHYGDRISDGASHNGVESRDVQALARALPKGAAQVEDIMISGCYSGSKPQLEAWHAAFPGTRSVWGYGTGTHQKADQSPTGAWAVRHMAAWEAATRGRGAPTEAVRARELMVSGNVSYLAAGAYHAATSVHAKEE